ncbi:hypothetical protein NVV94_05920 [Pseudomonas sp. LS1212]|uniref:hypothetical protein n=1 Tax=Pseudomonas sp. LS1212 TaxID=2972478 RepID=UPI00215C9CE0|nr:hypothetical protein [Pseudomonas sp. LS1212]UVJ45118.1 hypothetical protein NVV94_05920 [Pseudomonas sp. LS1212]
MMFDFYSWHPGVGFFFMAAPFAIGLIGQAITVYMVYRDLDEMKAAFPNSILIQNQMNMWAGSGFVARYMQVNVITGAVLLSGFWLRRGELDPDEVRNFPPHLKPRMIWSSWFLGVGLAWLFLAVGLVKLSEG